MTTTTVRRTKVATEGSLQTEAPEPLSAPSKPRMTATPKEPSEPPMVKPERPGKIAIWVSRKYRQIGAILSAVDAQCGGALIACADAAGMGWERLAKENRKIRDLILRLMESTTIGELFWAHLPLFLAVAVHHVPIVRKLIEQTSMGFLKEFGMAAPTMGTEAEAA